MLKVFEVFAGIGTQSLALDRLGIQYEVIGISEIDASAIISYASMRGCSFDRTLSESAQELIQSELLSRNIGFDFKHQKSKIPSMNKKQKSQLMLAHQFVNNFGDVSLIDPHTLPDFDFMTYSFPCQDLSVAGLRKGFTSGSRSGLLYECEKIITIKKPKFLLLENVKALMSPRFKPEFEGWIAYLESLGYTNYAQVLNAKDYGVPQNRERVFVVSVLGTHEPYKFPVKQSRKIQIRDILESVVDEKFYLNKPFRLVQKPNQAAELVMKGNESIKRVQSPDMICPCLTTMQGGHREPKIILRIPEPTICASRGRNITTPTNETPKPPTAQKIELNKAGVSNCLTTVQKDNWLLEPQVIKQDPSSESVSLRIRKLTPLECWRLMGIDEHLYQRAQAVTSNSQLYKQAGNAIVVNVLCAIFAELFSQYRGE